MPNPELPPHLQARYGLHRRRSQSFFVWLLVALVTLTSIAYVIFRNQQPEISFKLTSFSVVSADMVTVQWQVNRPKDQVTYCVIRAQDDNRRDAGYATIKIEAGNETVNSRYDLATSDRAVLAEILGCATNPTMRVPPANFPPGVKIPEQSPPGVAPTPQ